MNNDLVEQQNRIMIMNLHGTDDELENIEEREIEFLMKIELLLEHLDCLALQITRMSIGRGSIGGNNTGLMNVSTLLQAKKVETSNETENEDTEKKVQPRITTKNSIRSKMGNTVTQEISDDGGIEEHTNKRKFSTNNLKSSSDRRVSMVSIKDHTKKPRTLSILSHTTKKTSGWNKLKNNSQISAKLGKVPQAASIMSQSGLKSIKDVEMQKKPTSGNNKKDGVLQVRIEEMQKKVNMVFGQHVTRWRELRIATGKLLDKINQDLDKTKTAKNTKEMMEKLEKLENRRKSKEKSVVGEAASLDQFERGHSRKIRSNASLKSRMSLVSKMSQIDYK